MYFLYAEDLAEMCKKWKTILLLLERLFVFFCWEIPSASEVCFKDKTLMEKCFWVLQSQTVVPIWLFLFNLSNLHSMFRLSPWSHGTRFTKLSKKFANWQVRAGPYHPKMLPLDQKRVDTHTWYLSRTPRIYLCKFFLAGVNFYRFNPKNWQFTVYFAVITQKIGNFLCILS